MTLFEKWDFWGKIFLVIFSNFSGFQKFSTETLKENIVTYSLFHVNLYLGVNKTIHSSGFFYKFKLSSQESRTVPYSLSNLSHAINNW